MFNLLKTNYISLMDQNCRSILLTLLMVITLQIYSPAQIKRITTETQLTSIPISGMLNKSISFSNDMRRIAFRIEDGKKQIVVVDSIKGNAYDIASSPIFSPDSRRFAYVAHQGKKTFLIIDNKVELTLDSTSTISSVVFSPTSKNIAYVLIKDKKASLVYKGVSGKPYDAINENSISFSSDSRTVMYSAKSGNKQLNIIGKKEGPLYETVGFPIISPDGKQSAYWATRNGKTFMVLNEKESKPYSSIERIIFSNDGKRYAYHAKNEKGNIIVLDGIESEPYESAHSITFSPDGKHFAYIMRNSVGDTQGFKYYCVIDGKKVGAYEVVVEDNIYFSHNSESYSFKAELHDEFLIVNNGKDLKHYGDIVNGTLVYSPDDKRLAYAADKYTNRVVNLDGFESSAYNDILFIAFSPDSKRIAYTAVLDKKEFVVLDEISGYHYDAILGQGKFIFDAQDRFHYLASKGNAIFLVEEKIQ